MKDRAIRGRGYELIEKIGSGGFGAVYKAYQPAVDRDVAIKLILPKFANKPDFMQRFESEAQIVARLEHPHIVPLYDFWSEPSGTFIVMRYLSGGSLNKAIDQQDLDLKTITKWVDQIALALDAAHRHGVVHRDLKPANILLDKDSNSYLGDFGLAKDISGNHEQLTESSTAGTLLYMAPEQLKMESITPQTDLYSLGLIIYELLTKTNPFQSDSITQIIQYQLEKPLPRLKSTIPNLNDAVYLVLVKATSKKPTERYVSALAFAEAFRQAAHSGLVISPEEVDHEGELLLPKYLLEDEKADRVRPTFVGRDSELERLDGALKQAVEGRGKAIFIQGGAGRGKTYLLNEFSKRAIDSYPDLLIGIGKSSSFQDYGDPYLPFREILATLVGNVEYSYVSGQITHSLAIRNWEIRSESLRALREHGQSLLKLFFNSVEIQTDEEFEGSRSVLESVEAHKSAHTASTNSAANKVFHEYYDVLNAIATDHPLVIILDDLQWADAASISLLFHLAVRLSRCRILLISAFRPEEITPKEVDKTNPISKILTESKRLYGDTVLDLSSADALTGRQFIDDFLKTEPNRLSRDFANSLFLRTRGHPLFTVELLRTMQERGDLFLDEGEYWIEGSELNWEGLPPRIEGVIEERIGHLDDDLQNWLKIASIQGEEFIAQVICLLEDINERHLIQRLNKELVGHHRILREIGDVSVNGQIVTLYQFAHELFQAYLYGNQNPAERRLLHLECGNCLEDIYGSQIKKISGIMASHYRNGASPEKAAFYLSLVGDEARMLYAPVEAEDAYVEAIRYYKQLKNFESASKTLMKLALVHLGDYQHDRAQQAYDEAFDLWAPIQKLKSVNLPQPPKSTLRFAVELPSSLDPGLVHSNSDIFMVSQLFEGLVRIGEGHNVLPAAAERWSVTDGGKKYTFKLREGISWSDGSPLTAGDFEYAWKRNLASDFDCFGASCLHPILNARAYHLSETEDPQQIGVQATDDHLLEVYLESPTAYFPYLLTLPVTFPIPKSIIERKGQEWTRPGNFVGNGPYMLESWEMDNHLTLVTNSFYARNAIGIVGRVECSLFSDFDVALKSYLEDSIQGMTLFDAAPGTINQVSALCGDELFIIPRPSTLYILLKVDRPPFDDRRVRQAFATALDIETLVQKTLLHMAPANGGFLPPGMAGHSPGIGLGYDPSLASQLLSEAGYPNGRDFPEISWIHVQTSGSGQVIDFIKMQWRKNLGIDVSSEGLPSLEYYQRIDHDPADLTITGYSADYPDPDSMLGVTFHSQEGHGRTGWSNQRYDKLIEEAGSSTDQAHRITLYQEADRILVAEDTAVIPLAYGQGRVLVKPWVRLPEKLYEPVLFAEMQIVEV